MSQVVAVLKKQQDLLHEVRPVILSGSLWLESKDPQMACCGANS